MECVRCGAQVYRDEQGSLIDNSGGDVCGWDGGNELHELGDEGVPSDLPVELQLFHCDEHAQFDPGCHRCFLAEYGELDE